MGTGDRIQEMHLQLTPAGLFLHQFQSFAVDIPAIKLPYLARVRAPARPAWAAGAEK